MYTPAAFREDDPDTLRALVAASRLALLLSNGDAGLPDLTPLPLLWEGDALVGHLARANPHVAALRRAGRARAVFLGTEAYVSPGFYASKREHGRVVPTWNYEVVTAEGPVEILDDPTSLRAFVTRLTERHEAPRPEPWAVADAPPAFTEAQLRGIVGLRLTVERLAGKRKLSQNRGEADFTGVVTGLSTSDDPRDHAAAAAMSGLRRG